LRKLIHYFSTALLIFLVVLFCSFFASSPTVAATMAEQTAEYSTSLEVWQVFQELGSNLSGKAGMFTFRIKTDIPYSQQFEYTAQNARIYDKDNGGSAIAGCVPAGTSTTDLLRGLLLNTGNAPIGYMNVSIDFSCRNYTFIPGHRYLIKITNANRGTNIHFATSTTLTSPTDYFSQGGLRYTYANPFENICNPITYIWNSPVSNNGCIVFTSPRDDLYFILSDENGPTVPQPSPIPSPSPSPKTPLIFIPGIAGSELKINEDIPWVADDGHGSVYTHTYQKDEAIWLNGTQAALPGNDDYFDALRMLPDGKSSQAHITPTGKLLSVYDPTITYLTEHGYILGEDLFVFGYDWRKDLTETSNNFDSYLTTILQQKSASKANIITHSMGGLVARKYIENPENANKVNKLVTVAPPFLGSPKSLLSQIYGNCLTSDKIDFLPYCLGIPDSETKDIVQNLISMYTIKPSKKYYSFYNGSTNYPVAIRDESDRDGNLITGNLNYDQTKQLLTNLGYNTPLYTPAETFHEIDDNLNNTNGVDTTIIVGSGKATLGQIIEKSKYDFFGNKVATKDEIVINGDATVPLYSASLNDPSRNLSLFNPDKVFYVEDTHGGIIANDEVLDFAKSIFENDPTLPPDISQTPTPLNGSLFSVHSPVLIDAYDIQGNHTGTTNDGNYETNIPGSTYDTIDDAKFIFLPLGKYQFKFKATDEGAFDFKIRNYTENKNTSSQIYKDITLTSETIGYITVDQTTKENSPLNIDLNNDGTEDKQYYPTEYSSDYSDTLAPKTTILFDGQKGNNDWYKSDVQVSLEGIDETNGSDVAKVEYSLDKGITVQDYTEPFTISAEGLTNLRVKTTDKAGNEETLQSIDVKIDKTAPEAKIIFNLVTKEFDFIGIDNLGKTTKLDNGQTVTIIDEAGNTTKLTLTSKNRPRRENVSLKTIQYNNQAVIKLDNNLIGIFYTLDRNKQINFLLQRAVIQGEERLYSLYNPFTNKTEIIVKKPKMKISGQTQNGKTLLYFETQKGIIDSDF
jgi:pimeloyl-ACP methyl ester carboxylesterase